MTPGWYVTQKLNLLSLTIEVWKNSNVSSKKCLYKRIMSLNPNQQQVTTHKQRQSLSKYTKLSAVNDMLKSFDVRNNHETLEEQDDNTFD
jgi:hypothetical protein